MGHEGAPTEKSAPSSDPFAGYSAVPVRAADAAGKAWEAAQSAGGVDSLPDSKQQLLAKGECVFIVPCLGASLQRSETCVARCALCSCGNRAAA